MPLTSSHQRVSPNAAHLAAERIQPTHVARNRIVVKISIDHSPQPMRYNWNRLMASPHQRFADVRQRCAHPLLDCQSDDLEAAAVLTAAVREAEKVEGFRLSQSTFPASLRGVSSKHDKPCFIRVKFQLELG